MSFGDFCLWNIGTCWGICNLGQANFVFRLLQGVGKPTARSRAEFPQAVIAQIMSLCCFATLAWQVILLMRNIICTKYLSVPQRSLVLTDVLFLQFCTCTFAVIIFWFLTKAACATFSRSRDICFISCISVLLCFPCCVALWLFLCLSSFDLANLPWKFSNPGTKCIYLFLHDR